MFHGLGKRGIRNYTKAPPEQGGGGKRTCSPLRNFLGQAGHGPQKKESGKMLGTSGRGKPELEKNSLSRGQMSMMGREG